MRGESLRRASEAIVDRLELPRPFTARAFCETVAASRDRPVYLYPHAFTDGGVSGLCVSTEHADHIFHETRTTALHQEHIVLHELGHLVWGHTRVLPEADRWLSLPNLDATRILGILGRSAHCGEEEQAAELFAELVLHRVRLAWGRVDEPESDEVLARMHDALGA